jgi:DNA-binding PadR family transcriptional regulator
MRPPATTQLGYALLGLLQQQPSSGYQLRKIFSATSMKTYSDSPGAIYPALQRLERQGLIRGTVEQGAGLRRRRMFRLTPKGLSELRKWIVCPVTLEEVIWNQQETLLRFAFSEGTAGPAAARALLRSLAGVLKAYLPSLHAELRAMPATIPASGRLAFEYGIRGYEGLLQWTHYAIATYGKKGKGRELWSFQM